MMLESYHEICGEEVSGEDVGSQNDLSNFG